MQRRERSCPCGTKQSRQETDICVCHLPPVRVFFFFLLLMFFLLLVSNWFFVSSSVPPSESVCADAWLFVYWMYVLFYFFHDFCYFPFEYPFDFPVDAICILSWQKVNLILFIRRKRIYHLIFSLDFRFYLLVNFPGVLEKQLRQW